MRVGVKPDKFTSKGTIVDRQNKSGKIIEINAPGLHYASNQVPPKGSSKGQELQSVKINSLLQKSNITTTQENVQHGEKSNEI